MSKRSEQKYAISFAHKTMRRYVKDITDAGMSSSFIVSEQLGTKILQGKISLDDAISVYMAHKDPEVLLKDPKILRKAPLAEAGDYVAPKPEVEPESQEPILTRKKVLKMSSNEAAEMAETLKIGGPGTPHKDNVAALLSRCEQ